MDWVELKRISSSDLKKSDLRKLQNELKSINVEQLPIDELQNAFACFINIIENVCNKVSIILRLFLFISITFCVRFKAK